MKRCILFHICGSQTRSICDCSFQRASWPPIRTHNESLQKNLADAELFSLFYINYTPPRSGTFSSYTFTVCVVHLKQFWGHKNMFRQFACLCLLKRCQMYFVCLHILAINTQTQHLQAWNADSEWHSTNVYKYLCLAQMSLTKWLLKFTVCKSVKWGKKGCFTQTTHERPASPRRETWSRFCCGHVHMVMPHVMIHVKRTSL